MCVRLSVPKSKLIVADPVTGKSTSYELNDDQFRIFIGQKIGSEIDGTTLKLEGNIKLTGGSDTAGFPMREDVLGGVKKHVLLTKGVGFKAKEKGLKRRKMVRGNTITNDIFQINAVLISKPPKKKKQSAKLAKEVAKSEVAEDAMNAQNDASNHEKPTKVVDETIEKIPEMSSQEKARS